MHHLATRTVALALAPLSLGSCASTTQMQSPDGPVLVVVGTAVALPPVPDPPPPPPEPPPPPPPKVVLKPGLIELLEPVEFGAKDSALAEAAGPVLDDVAELLVANPWIRKLSIEVHTDRNGPTHANRKLARTRAKVLQDYLVAKGVEAARIAIKGHGEAKPLTKEKSDDADAQNRRLEFLIVEGEPPVAEATGEPK